MDKLIGRRSKPSPVVSASPSKRRTTQHLNLLHSQLKRMDFTLSSATMVSSHQLATTAELLLKLSGQEHTALTKLLSAMSLQRRQQSNKISLHYRAKFGGSIRV